MTKETPYEAGKRNGSIHDLLSPFWKAENEKEIRLFSILSHLPAHKNKYLSKREYWQGYAETANLKFN